MHIHALRLGTSTGTRMRTGEDALDNFLQTECGRALGKRIARMWHEKTCAPFCLTTAILASVRWEWGSVNEVLAFPRASSFHTSASLWVHFSGSSVFRHAAASGSGYCQQGGEERRFEEVLLTTDQADLYVGKERPAERVREVEHLTVVCARTRGV